MNNNTQNKVLKCPYHITEDGFVLLPYTKYLSLKRNLTRFKNSSKRYKSYYNRCLHEK